MKKAFKIVLFLLILGLLLYFTVPINRLFKAEVTGPAQKSSELFARIQQYQDEIKTNNNVFPFEVTPPVDGFRVISGTKNILLSAPHATRHVRLDDAGNKITKESDLCTGAIARVLGELTQSTVIFTTHKSPFDPNFFDVDDKGTLIPDDDTLIPYKDRMTKLTQDFRFVVVLDIHGAAEDQTFDVDIGTLEGESLLGKDQLLPPLKQALNAQGITKLSSNFFSAAEKQTVTKFSAKTLNIPAMQLEINAQFRCRTEADTIRLVRALEEYIRIIPLVNEVTVIITDHQKSVNNYQAVQRARTTVSLLDALIKEF